MNDLSTCGHLSFEGLYTHTSNMNDLSTCGHLSFEGLYTHTSNMNDLSACGHLRFEGLYTHTSNMNDLFDIHTFVCGRLSFMLQIRKDTFNLSTFV